MKLIRINLVICVLSFIGMSLVLISTSRFGAGISYDSANYISAARSLISGNGYIGFNGTPLAAHPPFFSTLLAIPGLIGIDPLIGARFINSIVFGLIIFASGRLFLKGCQSAKIAILGVISIALSTPILKVSVMTWSEPLFILLVILFIIYLQKFLSGKQKSILILISFITALSCIQRYIGVTLVFTGSISIVLLMRKDSLMQRLRYAIVFCVISLTPLFIWILRNYLLTKTFIGDQSHPGLGLLTNIYFASGALTTWILPHEVPFFIRAPAAALVVLIICAAFFLRSKGPWADNENKRSFIIVPTVIFMLSYITFLINSARIIILNRIDDRYLSPIYVTAVLLVLISIGLISDPLNKWVKNKKIINFTVIALFIIWLVYPLVNSIKQASNWLLKGTDGYNRTEWKESPLMEWLRTHELDGEICSNRPAAIYIITGKRAKSFKYINESNKPCHMRQSRESADSNKGIYIAWFSKKDLVLGSTNSMHSILELRQVAVLPDGTIYFLKLK